jgi:hypothetical protein
MFQTTVPVVSKLGTTLSSAPHGSAVPAARTTGWD